MLVPEAFAPGNHCFQLQPRLQHVFKYPEYKMTVLYSEGTTCGVCVLSVAACGVEV